MAERSGPSPEAVIAAFPHPVPIGAWGDPSQGMTLRDYFAAKALQGLMANPARYEYIAKRVAEGMSQEWASAKNANKAYYLADAMLKAREA